MSMRGNIKTPSLTLRGVVASLSLALALGMLIWVKLRLVTNVPRTAYADPKKQVERPAPAVDGRLTSESPDAAVPGSP